MTTIEKVQPTILSYVKDLPNLCSLTGLACSLLAIYFSLMEVYSAAMIGMVWAVGFDWADGLIARRLKGRTGNDRAFGGQLDLLIDIISYGVTPIILLLSYGNFEPALIPIAFIALATSAIRLSYFSTFGLSDNSQYTGLALDNNSLILVFVFLFEPLYPNNFLAVLTATILILSVLNVSQIKTPKFSGNSTNVYILALYTLAISSIYGWKLI